MCEQRINWGDGAYTLTREQVEILRACARIRELADHFAPPEIVRRRGVRADGTPVVMTTVRRRRSTRNEMYANLEATAGYEPETPEARAEWTKVRRICEKIARRWDREELLVNSQIARSAKQLQPQTVRSHHLRLGQTRARESRPARRARAGPSSDDPSEPGDNDSDRALARLKLSPGGSRLPYPRLRRIAGGSGAEGSRAA